MDKTKGKTTFVLIAFVVITYIIYSVLWMRVAFLYTDNLSTVELAEKISKGSTIRNVCELCSYIGFSLCCLNIWKETKRKFSDFCIKAGKIMFVIIIIGGASTLIQYFMTRMLDSVYFTPIIILFGIMLAVFFLMSGIEAKYDKNPSL